MSLTVLPPAGPPSLRVRRPEPPAEVLPGTPYIQLARTSRHRWWRPLVATLAAALALLWFMVVASIVLYGAGAAADILTPDLTSFINPMLDTAAIMTVLAFGIGAVFIGQVAWRRPIGSISSVAGHLRWRWLFDCAAVAVALMVVQVVIGFVAADGQWTWGPKSSIVGGLLIALLIVPFQSTAEEYVFRGWLLQFFGSFTRRAWLGALIGVPISSLLFVSVHGYQSWLAIDIFVMALVACYVTLRTGGLEAAIALHVVNNAFVVGLAGMTGSIAESMDQSATTSQDWMFVVLDIVVMVAFAAIVTVRARRKDVRSVA